MMHSGLLGLFAAHRKIPKRLATQKSVSGKVRKLLDYQAEVQKK